MSISTFFNTAKMAISHTVIKVKTHNEFKTFAIKLQENSHSALFSEEAIRIMNREFAGTTEYDRNRTDLFHDLLLEFEDYDNGTSVAAISELLGRSWSLWLEKIECTDVKLYTQSMTRFLFDIASEYENYSPLIDDLFEKIKNKCMGYNAIIIIPTLIELLRVLIVDGLGIEDQD